MTLGCIVLAHRDPGLVAGLVAALRHPEIRIYLHVDARVDPAGFREALAATGASEVAFLPQHKTSWGAPALVDAALEGLQQGVADDCDYFMLVSGQDFPLRPAAEIHAFAEAAGSRSYLEHWPMSESVHRFQGRDRTDFYAYSFLGRNALCIPRGEDTSFLGFRGKVLNQLMRVRSLGKGKRRFPPYAKAFAGAQWWNFSRAAADHVLGFVAEHPDYRRFHKHTVAPDEIFFHSILAGTGFAEEHEIVNDALRFYDWDDVHARTLTEADLPALLASDKLFARKLDPRVDSAVLSALAERVKS